MRISLAVGPTHVFVCDTRENGPDLADNAAVRTPQIGQHTYLTGDYSLRCDSPEWSYWALMAGVAFAVYVIGVPCLFWLMVYRARAHNVAKYLSLLAPYLRTLARANRMRAAMETYAAASGFVGKLRARLGQDKDDSGEAVYNFRVGHEDAPHKAAVERARRDLRTVTGGTLALTCDDMWTETLALVRDADAVHGLTAAERRAESLDNARLESRISHFLADDNLASTWVTQRCGFIFENYKRKLWWFENVRVL